jgi:hypothetical protein
MAPSMFGVWRGFESNAAPFSSNNGNESCAQQK